MPYATQNYNRRHGSKSKDINVIKREVRRWQYFNNSQIGNNPSNFDWYAIFLWPWWVHIDNALVDHPNQEQRMFFFVSNGMDPDIAMQNVMRDRIGMDQTSFNQMNC